MTIEVNPPPQIKLPSAFSRVREIREYFRHLDRMLLQLWKRTGGGQDDVSDPGDGGGFRLSSQIFDIRQQIGSGIPVTIDTTGFTVDTTEQTTDKTQV